MSPPPVRDSSVAAVTELEQYRGHGGQVSGFIPPLVIPGEYSLKYHFYETGTYFRNAPKVRLLFTIIDQGEHFGKEICAYYNVKWIKKPQKNGSFKAGFSSNLFRDFCRLFPKPSRPDRIPMSRLENVILIGRVDTVTKTANGAIPEAAQYSVVRELLRVEQ